MGSSTISKVQIHVATYLFFTVTQIVTFPCNYLLLLQSNSVTNSVTIWNK
jgi:hypothetical protein